MPSHSAYFYKKYGVLFIFVVLLGGGLWGVLNHKTSSNSAALPSEKFARASLTVSLTSPTIMRWNDILPVSGAVAAWKESIISAEVNGLKLLTLFANIGDHVKKGQLLASFDETSTRIELAQHEASVEEARAYMKEAKHNEERARSLRGTGAMSEQDNFQYQTKVQIAQAQLNAAHARVKTQQLKLGFTQILAPTDGIISSRSAIEGAVVSAGTELFRFLTNGRLEWRAELTAEQLSHVTAHQAAFLNLPDGSSVQGHVRQLSPTLDSTTRTALVYIDLESNLNESVRSGLYAKGGIVLGQHDNLAIPSASLIVRDGQEYVFTVDNQQHAKRLMVKTGRREQSMVEVLSGLDKHQRIILKGAGFLNDGDLVQVVSLPAEEPKLPLPHEETKEIPQSRTPKASKLSSFNSLKISTQLDRSVPLHIHTLPNNRPKEGTQQKYNKPSLMLTSTL